MSSDEEDDFEEDEVVLVAVEMGTELDETEEWPPPEDGPPRVNPSRVNPSGPPGGPLCSQVIEGGAYGCLLLAGHAGEHQLSADGKRKSKVPERLELEVPRRHSKKRSIIANAVTTVAPSADTVLAADGKLRAECDSATIDKKLGPGSAAAGRWPNSTRAGGRRGSGSITLQTAHAIKAPRMPRCTSLVAAPAPRLPTQRVVVRPWALQPSWAVLGVAARA